MFIDASAVVGIIANEPDQSMLIHKLESSGRRWISPIVVFEAVLALMRINGRSHLEMLALVQDFQTVYAVQLVEIDAQAAYDALDAFARFGKGVHPAKLNMGDCFTYALAKKLKQPVLFKGNDFGKTDIPICE